MRPTHVMKRPNRRPRRPNLRLQIRRRQFRPLDARLRRRRSYLRRQQLKLRLRTLRLRRRPRRYLRLGLSRPPRLLKRSLMRLMGQRHLRRKRLRQRLPPTPHLRRPAQPAPNHRALSSRDNGKEIRTLLSLKLRRSRFPAAFVRQHEGGRHTAVHARLWLKRTTHRSVADSSEFSSARQV
jgi:hypothetical protein